MTTLNVGAAAGEATARPDAADASGCRSPMPHQAAFASYGYDFYPQTFVRLVGCHQSRTSEAQPRKTAA
jgi:hypothetical protein